MRMLSTAFAGLLLAAIAAPALAAGMTSSMAMSSKPMMMKPGESVVMMPNGDTMMMSSPKKPDAAMQANMDAVMAAAKPMDACMVMMMGKDGKMYMVSDMKMADGTMMCDDMSKMK